VIEVYTDNEQQATITKLEIKRLRADLVRDEDGKEDFLDFQARCVRKFGAQAGIFVRQLVFWTGKGQDPSGFIYKSEAEWDLETGLSRDGQRKARKVLEKFDVLESRRRGLPCRLYFRVNLEKLAEILEDPYSTWNQWKRGTRKDPETGEFHRPEETTLNQSYSQDPIGTEQERSAWGPNKKGPHGDRTSEDPIGTEQVRTLYRPDKSGPYTDLANTESTYRDNVRRVTSENSSESSFRDSTFQVGADAQNRAAPPPQNNKKSSQEQEQEQEQDEGQPIPTTSLPLQPEAESRLLSEVRALLKNGDNAKVAVRHYHNGNADLKTVAEFVSQDATGSEDATEMFLPVVRTALEEIASESRVS
jgi:hypothetical protein